MKKYFYIIVTADRLDKSETHNFIEAKNLRGAARKIVDANYIYDYKYSDSYNKELNMISFMNESQGLYIGENELEVYKEAFLNEMTN